jgi:putative membrane-bound dehydrogenase-like protein
VRVYVCHSPDILVFEDLDGDGKADGPPKKLLSGFGGYDHDHGVHGILIGPDGKLYFSVGDTGVHGLQSSDGKGRKWTSNDTDCRAGTIWRCDLDGKNLELIAHNFRNEYEPCVDSFGTIFTSDNDDDGSEQTRICYVMPGGDYGYHPRGPGQSHWHEEQPGVVPKILRTGFGSPTGMCVYEGTLLPLVSKSDKASRGRKPPDFTTHLLHTDAGPREVRCYHLKPDGAGYQVEKEVLVSSTDTWFRPSDICVAPDGSAFVADWYDPGVGGHGMGDLIRGRIYRLAPKGNKQSVPKVDLTDSHGFIEALLSPNLAVRSMAITATHHLKRRYPPSEPVTLPIKNPLTKQEKDVVAAIAKAAENKESGILRARALWLCAYLNVPPSIPAFQSETRSALLEAGNPFDQDQLILFLRLMKESAPGRKQREQEDSRWNDRNGLIELLADKRKQIEKQMMLLAAKEGGRREILLLLRDVSPETATPWIMEAAKQYDGKDRFYLEAIGIAVGHHDQKRREIILADFEKHFPEWNDKVADLVWELRPPSMMAKLPKMLSDPSQSAATRTRIVDVLAGTPDTSGGQALIQALTPDMPPEVRDRILAKLKQFLPGKWRALRQSKETGEAIDRLMAKPENRLLALALIGAAAKEDAIGRVVDIARDGKESMAVRAAAIHALGTMTLPAATKALEDLITVEPAELRVHVPQALGEQLDMYAGGDKPAMKALRRLVTAKDQDQAVRLAAVTALVGTYHGTGWLLDANSRKELPDDLRAETGRLLRNSPFGDQRQRALAAFPSPKLDPAKLPDIARLAKLRGNAERGNKVLAATVKNDLQCMKCHTIHGVGGQIGPDLSMIGKKASRENLFESILYPSKAIADQYVTWNIATKDGKSVSGLLIEETGDHILIRDANGKDTKIGKKEIEARDKDPKSLMPDNLLAFMTEDELMDIVEYLLTLKEEEKK